MTFEAKPDETVKNNDVADEINDWRVNNIDGAGKSNDALVKNVDVADGSIDGPVKNIEVCGLINDGPVKNNDGFVNAVSPSQFMANSQAQVPLNLCSLSLRSSS
jgi:hypothetical protein